MTGSQEEEYQDVSKITKGTQREHVERVPGCHMLDQSEKGSRKKIKNEQTRSNAILLDDSVPADCVGKVVNTKTKEILYQKVSFQNPKYSQAAVEQEDERTREIFK